MGLPKGGAQRVAADISKWAPHLIALRSSVIHGDWRGPGRRRVCSGCRGQHEGRATRLANRAFDHTADWRTRFSTIHRLRDDNTPRPTKAIAGTNAPPSEVETLTPSTSSSTSLPSDTEKQRSAISKRMSRLMDSVLAHASIASQHINAYTGTDYSGIESLRRNIKLQELKVRECHTSLDTAKASHHDAVSGQTSAQREVVALLERKSSWSPADLERYMSLVRSEHVNEQAVQAAKDSLIISERDLEEARSLLERLERKQYHEEQVWSDTIRRNSTWVTFGLMGVNILLLLAQIAIFEPYRRKKIVRDVKLALDEKTVTAPIPDSAILSDAPYAPSQAGSQGDSKPSGPLDTIFSSEPEHGNTAHVAEDQMVPSDVSDFVGVIPSDQDSSPAKDKAFAPTSLASYQNALRDLFSERVVEMRRIDVTGTAISGLVTGAAIMGAVVMIIRPR